MLGEVVKYLEPKEGGYFIDCTLGGGGYTTAISEKIGKTGKILAIDLDESALAKYKSKIKNKNINLKNGNFKDLSNIIKEVFSGQPAIKFDGIVLDLGLSSTQLEDRARGFSFQLLESPLNMAFGRQVFIDTLTIVNEWPERELEKIIREYGEEKFSRRIAKKIIEQRKIKRIEKVGELVEIIKKAVPFKYQRNKIHFATRTFQALRIATNNELENLKEVLPRAAEALKKGGRIAIISFHSLEDRIVKLFFKKESKDCLCPPKAPACQCGHKASLKIIRKKILTPSEEEIKNNPRARSAKMRVAEKI